MGCLINEFHCKRVQGYLENHGGEVLIGAASSKDVIEDQFIPPTIIKEPRLDSDVMTNEIFGPILPVLAFKTIDDVIKLINDRPKPLALYYFGRVVFNSNKDRLYAETSCGNGAVNECLFQIANSDLPFGGVGNSGYGKYHGLAGFRALSNSKALLIKPALNFYPYT